MASGCSEELEWLTKQKDRLESVLVGEDLLELSHDLLESRVFPEGVLEKLTALDWNLIKPARGVRYFLQQVLERIKVDCKVLGRLLTSLNKLEGVKKEFGSLSWTEGRDTSKSEVGKEWKRCLSESDVPALVNILHSGSHKWEEIGIALNISQSDSENCRRERNNVVSLRNILTAWVISCSIPTLDRLRKAVEGVIVNMPNTAQNLLSLDRPDHSSSETESRSISSTEVEIVGQSYATKVNEGKSTLLEVQLSGSGGESYQWSKDGQPLQEGVDFSGVSSNMLYVNRARQGAEGKYSCCVRSGSETVHSDDINVTVIYSPHKEHLMKLYRLRESEVPIDSWPPVSNTTFINLVLVEQSVSSQMDYYTIRGDMDDIVEAKENISYENVFREYREGALLLVEGRPGSGKTTLVHKVTRDWAIQGEVLQEARMVFLVTLRLVNVSGKHKSLGDLLGIFYGGELRDTVEQKLLASGGIGACFILDGLDEYPVEREGKSVISQLISKEILPLSMVIVASRPVATRDLKQKCKSRVEVIGFTKKQINSYIDTYPYSYDELESTDMSFKLKVYLSQHPNVQHMCYLPVHAAMICFLFSQHGGNIPQTETKIYEQFVIATLLRHKTRSKEEQTLKSLKDLCSEEKEKFICICKLAFDMIKSSQQVVSKTDAHISTSGDSYLGLLTVERTYKSYGSEELLSFQHLSIQEYLAAFYVSTLAEGMITILGLNRPKLHARFKNVWKLYSGLVEYRENTDFLNTVLKEMIFYGLLDGIHCAFESQQMEFCDLVVGDGALKLDLSVISSFDFMALGYVISNSSRRTFKLIFRECQWDDECVGALSLMADKDKLSGIRSLEVVSRRRSESFLKGINILLCQLPSLEALDLSIYVSDESSVKQLTSKVVLSSLQFLGIAVPVVPFSHPEEVLGLLKFGSDKIKKVVLYNFEDSDTKMYMWRKLFAYAFGFQDCEISWLHFFNSEAILLANKSRLTYCTDVVLVNCGIEDSDVQTLADNLSTPILEKIVLDFNRISDLGTNALADCIAKCTILWEFSIQCNCISDSGAIALAGTLAHCSSLRRLDLQGNALGDEGAVAVAKATDCWLHLDLYLHNVNVSDTGMERVLDQRPGTNIRKMVFSSSWNSICSAGEEALERAMSSCPNVPALKLSESNIHMLEYVVKNKQMTNITALECDKLSEATVPILCSIMGCLRELRHFEFHGVEFVNSRNALLICDSIKKCKCIHSLSLHGEVRLFRASLLETVKCCGNLQSLHLTRCRLCLEPGDSVFSNSHIFWASLHTLKLVDNIFDCSKADNIFDCSKADNICLHSKNLCHLDLRANYFDSRFLITLVEAIRTHTGLKELYLNLPNCDVDEILLRLVQVIKNNCLRVLHLVRFIPSCLTNLIQVLHEQSLQSLTLRCISCDLIDIILFSIKIREFNKLVKFNIEGSKIGPIGMICLAEGLQHCANLEELILDDNKISSAGVPAILDVMDSCRYLKKLSLNNNALTVNDATLLVGRWKHPTMLTIHLNRPHQFLKKEKKCCCSCHHMELFNKCDYVLLIKKGEECCCSGHHLLELNSKNDYVILMLSK